MRISDVLRGKGDLVVTISPDQSVAALLESLAEHGVGALVVSTDGVQVAGIVSERDVVRHLTAMGDGLLDRPVQTIMTSEVHSCEPDTEVDDLMVMMTERRIRHVPVLVEGRMVGIVSIGDVVKHRVAELQTEAQTLHDYLETGR
jgi:CBS domain-containing protein